MRSWRLILAVVVISVLLVGCGGGGGNSYGGASSKYSAMDADNTAGGYDRPPVPPTYDD